MDDLVTWLRAQLDEDERLARAAGGDAWAEDGNSVTSAALAQGDFSKRGYWVASASFSCEGETESLREGHAEHIARHDPARVLREVEAKRRIVDEYASARDVSRKAWANYGAWASGDPEPYPGAPSSDRADKVIPGLEVAVRLLALPYADRPWYRDEWRP